MYVWIDSYYCVAINLCNTMDISFCIYTWLIFGGLITNTDPYIPKLYNIN